MILANSKRFRRCAKAAVVGVSTALTVVSSAAGQTGLTITFKGFLLDNGVLTTIEHADAISVTASGINDHGQIVGSYVDAEGTTHGFLLHKGKFTTIDVPGGYPQESRDNFSAGARYILSSFVAGFETSFCCNLIDHKELSWVACAVLLISLTTLHGASP